LQVDDDVYMQLQRLVAASLQWSRMGAGWFLLHNWRSGCMEQNRMIIWRAMDAPLLESRGCNAHTHLFLKLTDYSCMPACEGYKGC